MCTGEGHAPAAVNEAIKVQEQVAGGGVSLLPRIQRHDRRGCARIVNWAAPLLRRATFH